MARKAPKKNSSGSSKAKAPAAKSKAVAKPPTTKKLAAKPAATKAKTTAKKAAAKKTRSIASIGKVRTLHQISDATGNLANHIVASLLGQFGELEVERIAHRFQDTPEKLAKTLAAIKDSRRDVVVHSVVDPVSKQIIEAHCVAKGIPCRDLTGDTSQFLATTLEAKPINDPDLLHKVDEDYFRRIDAMEFTLQHDDSRRLESIDQAEIVLLGISRVSKSPTSTFLGSLGYRTANVSIHPDLGLPAELKRCKGRVVALTMQAGKLYEIRKRRFEINGFAREFAARDETISYLEPREVSREVMAAEALYRQAGFPIVDVTGMTIEEAATHVLETLGLAEPR